MHCHVYIKNDAMHDVLIELTTKTKFTILLLITEITFKNVSSTIVKFCFYK